MFALGVSHPSTVTELASTKTEVAGCGVDYFQYEYIKMTNTASCLGVNTQRLSEIHVQQNSKNTMSDCIYV